MRRFLKVTTWTVGGAVVLAALLVGGVMIAGNTDAGRGWINR